jgi:hypothetical protein
VYAIARCTPDHLVDFHARSPLRRRRERRVLIKHFLNQFAARTGADDAGAIGVQEGFAGVASALSMASAAAWWPALAALIVSRSSLVPRRRPHLMACHRQGSGNRAADIAAGAGDEDFHLRSNTPPLSPRSYDVT